MKRPAPIIVIFGISGDLASRKLLPALYHLLTYDFLPEDTTIIGVSRHDIDAAELLSDVELCVLEKNNVCDPAGVKKLKNALLVVQADDDLTQLAETINHHDESSNRERLFYLSIPPKAYQTTTKQLAEVGLNGERDRLLIEKPIGHDTASAEQLIDSIGQYYSEEQVYRIDHFLAKETAQNLLAFRLHNPIFSTLWDDRSIASVHVRAAETIGVENRVEFYEHTGALRDMLQAHLMQLLSLTMMEKPEDSSSQAVHRAKEAFLESLRPAEPNRATRGRYRGYTDEVENSGSTTETYARIELRSSLPQWTKTRITLESGKALAEKSNDITVQFASSGETERNRLVFTLQPSEGIMLDLVVKRPGFEDDYEHKALSFDYETGFDAKSGHPDAYERVIMDAIRGDQSLFASDREVLASWRAIQPLLDAWKGNGDGMISYDKGTTPNA